MDEKENSKALYTILRNEHANGYQGLDDDMNDHLDDWISELSEDEVCEIILSIYRKGI